MKRILLVLVSVFITFGCFGQRELFPIDWNKVQEEVKISPEHVMSLARRLSTPTLDTTLTYEDRRLAFFGQSILTEDKEDYLAKLASNLYGQGQFQEALDKAQMALSINPLNLEALKYAENSILQMIEAGNDKWKESDAEVYYNRAMRIYNTIATTGDGSDEYPFFITKVSDEYNFMRFYLDLWKYESQSLIGVCDVFALTEGSQYYDSKTISFNALRPLMITHKKFSSGKKNGEGQ